MHTLPPASPPLAAAASAAQPARVDLDPPSALAQAEQVFMAGNGLPGRWAGRRRFVVLDTGFGHGHNFLATWAAWRADARRCTQLVYVSIDRHRLPRDDLRHAHAHSPLAALSTALVDAWPPQTPDVHVLDFDHGCVRLLLVQADAAQALTELVLHADAFYLNGFAPARHPGQWDTHRLRALGRLAAPGATVATWHVARGVLDGLRTAGFQMTQVASLGSQREMAVGHHAPRHVALPPPGRRSSGARAVVVVGAGLAGAGVARALALQGVQVEVLERLRGPAEATSGNPGGLFHGIVHAHDGPHARWLRAAALETSRLLAPAIGDGRLPGAVGLLRGERQLDLDTMRHLIHRQALPPEWVQALDAAAATALAGSPWSRPAWYYPGGGWVDPAALVAQWLATPGITLRAGQHVGALVPHGTGWRMLDASGQPLAQAEAVVLANAADAMRLLQEPAWPWQSLRGQVSLLDSLSPPLPLPLADQGYALRLSDKRVLCGATSQADDPEAALRATDHAHNLAALQRLTGWAPPAAPTGGRVGWRMQPADRMPLLGPVPSDGPAPAHRADQPRFAPRRPGLWVACGYGARGITHAALAGEVLAAWITGAPMPLPGSLLDALDPARFAARLSRRPAS